MSQNVVFLGTPQFAVAPLRALADVHDVRLVLTAPDAVRSRGKKAEPSPVKAAAEELGLAVRTPKTLRDEALRCELEAVAPDVICVAAYGLLLPEWVLALPHHGCLNVHGSLLPRWRGAAPIERAILAGDETCGVSIMKMEAGLDTGPYCLKRSIGIGSKSARELNDELSALGAEALLDALGELESGSLLWTEQDEREVTYASKLEKGELNGDPAATTLDNLRRIQASGDAHPSRCFIGGKPVTLLSARAMAPEAAELGDDLAAGDVRWREKLLLFGCGDGAFEVTSLKPDGKRAMDAAAFVAGQSAIRAGDARWAPLVR